MDRLIQLERELASLIDAVETYTADQRPATYDSMENAMNAAKRRLYGESK